MCRVKKKGKRGRNLSPEFNTPYGKSNRPRWKRDKSCRNGSLGDQPKRGGVGRKKENTLLALKQLVNIEVSHPVMGGVVFLSVKCVYLL